MQYLQFTLLLLTKIHYIYIYIVALHWPIGPVKNTGSDLELVLRVKYPPSKRNLYGKGQG